MPMQRTFALMALAAALAAPAYAQQQPPASLAPASAPAAKPDTQAKEAEASLAAQGWRGLLDRKDWGRAWETTGAVFRSKVPLGAWMDAIPKVREPLGTFVQRAPVEPAYRTTLQGQPDGEYVTVVFASKFSSKEVAEVVTTVHE